MSCKYCKAVLNDGNDTKEIDKNLWIEDVNFIYNNATMKLTPISYCPMCGQKLSKVGGRNE